MSNPNSPTPLADLLGENARTLIETANLDWQVAEYVRYYRKLVEHSSYELIAAAVREIAVAQHGAAFAQAVRAYDPQVEA